MSNKFAVKAWAEPLRTVAFVSLTGSLAAIGLPLANPARVMFVTNGTDANVDISLDGVHNMFCLLPGSSLTLDLTTNKSNDEGLFFAIGTQIYVAYESVVPTVGNVYLSIVYGTTGTTL